MRQAKSNGFRREEFGNGQRHRAESVCGKVRNGGFGSLGKIDRDDVAATDTQCPQCVGKSIHRLEHLPPAPALNPALIVLEDQTDVVGAMLMAQQAVRHDAVIAWNRPAMSSASVVDVEGISYALVA